MRPGKYQYLTRITVTISMIILITVMASPPLHQDTRFDNTNQRFDHQIDLTKPSILLLMDTIYTNCSQVQFNSIMKLHNFEDIFIGLILLQNKQWSSSSISNGITIVNGKAYTIETVRSEEISKLRGKTLEIYALLLESGESYGIREIQRHFEYSSPNLATYHLKKLYELDLVTKTSDNRYKINNEVNLIGEYKSKFQVGRIWVDYSLLHTFFVILLCLIGLIMTFVKLEAYYWSMVFLPLLSLLAVHMILTKS